MRIPYAVNILICLFCILASTYAYRRVEPENQIFNQKFGLAAGGAALAILNVAFMVLRLDPTYSTWLFLPVLVWAFLTVRMLRRLPERPRKPR
jgi:hypothetical protein